MSDKPNIIYFLVDDMGYGDASCFNPNGKIKTPNIDRLANEGIRFTDAHSTSAVCSPSRYGVLTGRYNWRTSLQKGIVQPYGDPLIASDRMTVPKLLRNCGYDTVCIGKWHLGMGFDFNVTEDFLPPHDYDSATGYDALEPTQQQRFLWAEAFAKPFKGGPLAAGFDRYFGVDVPNWPPYCFIENDRTVGIPSEWLQPQLLGNNLASLQGPAMPYWNFEQLLPAFAVKAAKYIQSKTACGEPFFLYMPMTSPHTPLSVNKPFIGRSGLDNLYADLVIETDAVLGHVLDTLEACGIAQDTLVIFASDNGCAPYIGVNEMEMQGHYPSAQFSGYKSDVWDGGHRVPFVARWPEFIAPDSLFDGIISLSDFIATCAEITGQKLPDNAGEDSVSLLPVFRGETDKVRDSVVNHSITGKFAIRDGDWKLVLCPGSGGWSKDDEKAFLENLPLVQLYNMREDPGEKCNLYQEHPGRVKEMITLLQNIVDRGRSTPGAQQKNDVPVDIWKLDTMPGATPMMINDY